MAKNKKSDRTQQQRQSERETQQARDTSMEQHAAHVTPADVAQKGRQKRFGHN
ncbi:MULTISPECIES: hypothetical protein [unclassified Streptomyces]|uniref:hypothetical protein n=1 Tax=unclassified Streptomyces TaxID=2593676 RepID=UPI001587453F|nr:MULTISPECIES: hypothetical protein [unclassified Streptomyces]